MRSHGKASPAATAGSSTPKNGGTFSLGVIATILACAAAFLGIGAPAASAAPEAKPGYAYLTTFGSGELAGPCCSRVRNPVALDGNGNIFVADENIGVVAIFAPDALLGGTRLSEIPVTSTGNQVADVAVDPTTGAAYTQGFVFGTPEIRRWVSDGQPAPTYTLDPGFQVGAVGEGIAVDPITHDLLVADAGAESIRRYDTSGALVATIATPGLAPQRIATAPDGSIYVAQESSADVTRLSGTGTVLDVVEGVGAVSALAVDPSNGRLVASVEGKLRSYSSTGAFLSDSAWQGEAGIAIDGTSGRLYGFAGTSVNVYSPAVIPGVEAPTVSAIGPDSAHVSAEVDPGAGPPEGSVARFEYSEDGGAHWSSMPDQPLNGAEEIKADLTGLELNWDFLVRVKASNSLASATSAATSFSTPEIAPQVETGVAGDITETSALLNGTVNPAGQLTTYHFEYGLTASYGSRVPVATEAPAGNLRQPRAVARTITGLQPETTYHYRLVASNVSGETEGADRTFTTVGPDEAVPARAYEQVTPVDQHGAVVNGAGHFTAAADGSWFVTGSGAAEADGTSSQIWQNFLSRRGPTGWSDWEQIDPPRSIAVLTTESLVAAVSDDGTHALVVSNRVLAQGAIEGGGNLYVYDLDSGAFTFVGGSPESDAFYAYTGIFNLQQIFLWGSPDFSSVVFHSPPPLLLGAGRSQNYRWSRGTGLELESVMPNGGPSLGAVQDRGNVPTALPAVSDDGSVSYFGISGSADSGVYRRTNGQTTAISVIEGDPTDTPQAGEFFGASRDGRYAYFSSNELLTSDAVTTGVPMLYRYDAVSEELTYLSPIYYSTSFHAISDDGQTAYFSNESSLILKVVRGDEVRVAGSEGEVGVISPNGRYYGWTEGNKVQLYDADTDSTVCVSCLPDGSAGAAVYLRSAGPRSDHRPLRVIFDNGLLLFSTENQLVTADHNSFFDVYAYQHGQITLISPGDGPYDARITEASADAKDIFFTTDESLVAQDTNGVTDMYDARVGGGFPESTPATECEGDACKGPLAAPPRASAFGSSVLANRSGSDSAASAITVKKLSAADRAILAKGGKAHLKVKVSGPGKVTVSGRASGSAKAKKAGTVSVPISLSEGALSELRTKGSLTLSLTVRFKDAKPKVVSVTLRSTTSKKGGSR